MSNTHRHLVWTVRISEGPQLTQTTTVILLTVHSPPTLMSLMTPQGSPSSSEHHDRITRTCGALLVDETTPCDAILRNESARFCHNHGREYRELTAAYKQLSRDAELLGDQARLSSTEIRAMHDIPSIAAAISLAERWRDALAKEIRGRETHHRRFFRTRTFGLVE